MKRGEKEESMGREGGRGRGEERVEREERGE